MSNLFKIHFIVFLAVSFLYAEDNVGAKDTIREKITRIGQGEVKQADDVSTFNELFINGKVSGQIEIMYSGHEERGVNSTNTDPYSTAVGGQLMFETAHLYGFGAAAEFTTVHEIGVLSGDNDDEQRASMMVSGEGDYTELSQAYLEYTMNDFTLRVGRQLIDTPLADSDDIRIVNNTFQAYTARYETESITVMAGFLEKWQGTDTGLVDSTYTPADTDAWQNTGKNGTLFAGVNYESDILHLGAWYYDISETDLNQNSLGQNIGNRSIYADVTIHALNGYGMNIDLSTQYLQQNEENNSGTEADIYGLMIEVNIDDLDFLVAYNRRDADDSQTSFSGFGGGTLYTNLDNMIIDTISGGDVDAYVGAIAYEISNLTIGYAYGKFMRDATTTLIKEEIIEHNIGAEYSMSDNLTFFAIVTINDDKEDTGTGAINNSGDFTNVRVSASYNF